jgi:hypothetical protein
MWDTATLHNSSSCLWTLVPSTVAVAPEAASVPLRMASTTELNPFACAIARALAPSWKVRWHKDRGRVGCTASAPPSSFPSVREASTFTGHIMCVHVCGCVVVCVVVRVVVCVCVPVVQWERRSEWVSADPHHAY